MQALPQILRLQSLESIIERSQQMIVPETPLFRCDVYDGLSVETDAYVDNEMERVIISKDTLSAITGAASVGSTASCR